MLEHWLQKCLSVRIETASAGSVSIQQGVCANDLQRLGVLS